MNQGKKQPSRNNMKINLIELKKLIREEYNRLMDDELEEVESVGLEDKGCEWYEKDNPVGEFEMIGSHLRESDDEVDEDSMYSEIEMRMGPTDFKLSLRDIEEISQMYDVSEEDVIDEMNSYLSDRDLERQRDLSYWVSACINEMNEEGVDVNHQTFKDYFYDNMYDGELSWASEGSVMDEFKNQTEDPNQLKLDLKESIKTIKVLSEEIQRMKNVIRH